MLRRRRKVKTRKVKTKKCLADCRAFFYFAIQKTFITFATYFLIKKIYGNLNIRI